MTGQRSRELEAAYSHYLKNQIVDQGSSLPCTDENFINEVEELLKNEDGHNTHCLGLDTFDIMEESLRSSGTDGKQATKVRTGLNGLAKAFEVLEQAALNLYLSPWREEYKVVKMYSGIFTHCIKPVFSTHQVEVLFGLLGYKKSQREQLRLQPEQISADSLEELLRMACAFFVGRCECRLLLAGLGKYAGQPQWELNVVRERQRGYTIETALDNTLRKVDVKQPLQELPEESDMDLYTAEQDDEEQREMTVDEPPRSLTWMPNKSANGVHREPSYFSTRHHQNSEVDSTANGFSSISRYLYKESSVDKNESLPVSLEEKEDNELPCTCVTVTTGLFYTCTECQIYHRRNCPKLEPCQRNHNTNVEYVDEIPENFFTSGATVSEHKGSLSPTLTRSSGALSSLTLQDKYESYSSFNNHLDMHNCIEGPIHEPQLLCFTCQAFHTDYCNEAKNCLSSHQAKKLGFCSVEKCSKPTQILCKYCGNEYCKDCWYVNPIKCRCGQTLDYSSSV